MDEQLELAVGLPAEKPVKAAKASNKFEPLFKEIEAKPGGAIVVARVKTFLGML